MDNGRILSSADISSFTWSAGKNAGFYIARNKYYGNRTSPERQYQYGASKKMKTLVDSYYCSSDLMNSYAWDTALMFICRFSEDSNYSKRNNIINGQFKWNHDILKSYEECNIINLGGYYPECTTEHGVDYDNGKYTALVSFRGVNYPESRGEFGVTEDGALTFRDCLTILH